MTRKADKWDMDFLMDCEFISRKSKDPSTKCGAKIISPNRATVSEGYNGFPMGMDDDPAIYANREKKYEKIIHCEMNALIFAPVPVVGCTLYTWPLLSCPRCTVHMIQAGIIRFVAPRIPESKVDRWAEKLITSRKFIEEAGASWTEIDVARATVFREHDAPLGVKEMIEEEFRT